MWCVPEIDAEYERRMHDVLETYERPLHDRVPVVCLDEKLVELRKEVRPDRRTSKGICLRDYGYKRMGTANVFVVSEPKGGVHFARVTERRTRLDFAETLSCIASRYPKAHTIHLVMDNLNTHNEKSLIARYGDYEGRALWARFTPHYTPKHASWLNQAEIVIHLFSRTCLCGQHVSSSSDLCGLAADFFKKRSQDKWTINWKWTRKHAKIWLKTFRKQH